MAKLTLKEAKERFATTGECFHEKDHQYKVNPYNCPNLVQVMCRACNKLLDEIRS